MIVFIGGMQRSGSTVTFNIVRELLANRGLVYHEASCDIGAVRLRAGSAEHLVLKAHTADPDSLRVLTSGEVRIVCTARERPEDAIASWATTFHYSLEESIGHMKEWINFFNTIKVHALLINFEKIEQDLRSVIQDVAHYLGIVVTRSELDALSTVYSKEAVGARTRDMLRDGPGTVDVGFSYYDSTTFFHRNHVATNRPSTAIELIGPAGVSQVRTALGDSLDETGKLKTFRA